jgi:diguanylate cyclase (GGDEF)-like protein
VCSSDLSVTRVRKIVQINLGAWLLLVHIAGYNIWFSTTGNEALMRSGWVQLPVAALIPLLFWLQTRRQMTLARSLLMVLGTGDAVLAMLAGQGTAAGVHMYLLLFALLLPSLTEVELSWLMAPASASLVAVFLALNHWGWPAHPALDTLPPPTLYALQYVILLSCLVSIWSATALTELAAALNERRLQEMAETDPLTDLPNRRRWDSLLAMEARRAVRTSAPMVIGVLDLDHFKQVNDTLGHEGGDLALRHFTEVVQGQLRAGDVLARTGGEEFSLLLPATTLAEAKLVAERVRRAVAERPLQHAGQAHAITLSIGLAPVDDLADLRTPIKRADAATYRAKREGRNRVCVAEAPGQ